MIAEEKIRAAIEALGRSERGRRVAAALHEFLDGDAGVSGLDMNGQRAMLDLLDCSFDGHWGSVLEALEPFGRS